MTKGYQLLLGDRILPLDMQALAVDECGDMVTVDCSFPLRFGFVIHGVPFAAVLDESDEGIGLSLLGELGPMPYSAEAVQARVNLHAVIDAANEHLGPHLEVSNDGRMLLHRRAIIRGPLTAVNIISAIARLLLPSAGYLECVAAFVRPPALAAKQGESAVLPEWRNRRCGQRAGAAST